MRSGDRPGDNNSPPRTPDQAYSDAIATVNSHLSGIQSVVIVGYSWGGGMAKRLAGGFAGTGVEVAGLVYVDAVIHGLAGRERQLPNVPISSFLNIFQSDITSPLDAPVAIDGMPYHITNPGLSIFNGATYYGAYSEVDVDQGNVDRTSHTKIDNDTRNLVATFIESVLSGWYYHRKA